MRLLPLLVILLPAAAHADDAATALRDPAALPQRAHVARVGPFGLTHGEVIDDEGHRREGASYDEVPVVEARGDRVRIVHEEDDARMLMWVASGDLAWAITREVRIKGKGEVGVWLLRGARVTARGSGARRRVTASFDELTVTGVVPETALGKRFARPAGAADRSTARAAAVLDAPDGRALVGTPDGLQIVVISPGPDDWQLVEHRSRYLRVRGWARKRDFLEQWHTSGTGMGGGYGMSHVARVDVRDGTCFHASPGGPVVGKQLGDRVRYAPGRDPDWHTLYVGNAWGLFQVHARVESVGADGKPVFARCR